MRQGLTSGWAMPAQAIARVPGQIAAWAADDVEQSPAWRPFAQFPKGMPVTEQGRLAAAGKRAIADDVTPAFRRLKAFVETAYLPAARKDIGASTLPGGPAYYAGQIARQTTTALSAQAIHDLGLSEVERICVELDAAMRGTGFTGTRAEFFFLLSDAAVVLGLRDLPDRTYHSRPPAALERAHRRSVTSLVWIARNSKGG